MGPFIIETTIQPEMWGISKRREQLRTGKRKELQIWEEQIVKSFSIQFVVCTVELKTFFEHNIGIDNVKTQNSRTLYGNEL